MHVSRIRKTIILLVILIGGIFLGIGKAETSIKSSGKILEILGIQHDDIQCIAIRSFYSTRIVNSEINMKRFLLFMDQEVVLSDVYDDKKPSGGESDYTAYIFLNTGEFIKLGVYEDGIILEKKNKKYHFLGMFDTESLDEFPIIENTTEFWNEQATYQEW